jgi:uncharacterized protein
VRLQVLDGLAGIEPSAWDALVGDASPFLEWAWLASLEEAECVSARTGWLPQHLALYDGDALIGACPLYVKGHSQGEFVFDHGWAEGARRAGLRYYPKLLVAVPFTPAAGRRFLVHPDADRAAAMRILATSLKELCGRGDFSSAHVNFCLPDERDALVEAGFEERTAYQYQWINPGWRTFDDYLAALRSKRRHQVKRERRALDEQGISIEALVGDAIPDAMITPMFRLYKSTVDKFYWGHQYLNRHLFDLLAKRWRHRLCFIVARREGELIAGTFNVQKPPVLYGRYWGTREDVPFLHFNVCYYAAIEHCLRHGIERFEPGAGGEFKHLRGFDARPTTSMHYIADRRLAHAVGDFLTEERRMVEHEIAWLDTRTARKRG